LSTDSKLMPNPECGCLYHKGPHWLLVDYNDRADNIMLVETALRAARNNQPEDAIRYLRAYGEAELRRLQEKRRNANQSKMTFFPYTLLGSNYRTDSYFQELVQGYLMEIVQISQRRAQEIKSAEEEKERAVA
jgi:hypothetical protein